MDLLQFEQTRIPALPWDIKCKSFLLSSLLNVLCSRRWRWKWRAKPNCWARRCGPSAPHWRRKRRPPHHEYSGISFLQGFVSGSGLDPYSESGSGSKRAKMTHKSRKKCVKVQVLMCWMASFESWRLLLQLRHTLWRPGIGKLQFLILKKI